jgi:hypothetical protein
VPPKDITINFEPVETIQPRTEAEIIEILGRAGVPLVTILRRNGWSQAEIDQLIVDKDEERQANQASLGQALMQAQRNMDNPEVNDGE